MEDRTLLTLTFNFNYIVDAAGTDVGFNNSTDGPTYKAMLENAAATLGSWFDHDATIDVDVRSYDENDGSLASAAPRYSAGIPRGAGFDNFSETAHIIFGGTDPTPTTFDMDIEVNFDPNYGMGLDVANNQDDLVANVMHEIMHGLEFGTTLGFSGSSFLGSNNRWSRFDQFLSDKDGNRVVDDESLLLDSTVWNAVRTGGASPNSGLFFDGPNAKAANEGKRVGLFSPGSYDGGSSASHVDDANPDIDAFTYLMVAAGAFGQNARVLHPVEFGIMQDLGYSMIQPDVVVTESDGSTTVSESGTTDTFTVALTTRPLEDVLIGLASLDTDEATLDESLLTFTPENWDIPQTVTVTGVADVTFDDDQSVPIEVSFIQRDDSYAFAPASTVFDATNENIDEFTPTFIVNTLVDDTATDGKISLREAILATGSNTPTGDAPAGSSEMVDFITFDPSLSGGIINLASDLSGLLDDMQIIGLGADQLTIDGGDQHHLFVIESGVTARITGLTIANGISDRGAGVRNFGITTLDEVFIRDNQSTADEDSGGGVWNVGTLTIRNSIIYRNSALGNGGGSGVTGRSI